MRGWLLILVLLLLLAAGAPYIDGQNFKKVYLARINTLMSENLVDKNIKIEIKNYQAGWLHSTVTEKITNLNATAIPIGSITIDTVIDHGPVVKDPITGSYTLGFAVVHSKVHFPPLVTAFVPDNGEGLVQFDTLVSFDGDHWQSRYSIQPVNFLNRFKWDGANGSGTFIFGGKGNLHVEGTVNIGAISVPHNPDHPSMPTLDVQPMLYNIVADTNILKFYDGKSTLSTAGFVFKWPDNEELDAETLAVQNVFGIKAGSKLYNYQSSATLGDLMLPPSLLITQVNNIHEDFVLKDLDVEGIKDYMEAANNFGLTHDTGALADSMMKILSPSSAFSLALSGDTQFGKTSGSLKITLSALPATRSELANDINAEVNLSASTELVESMVTQFYRNHQPANMNAATQAPIINPAKNTVLDWFKHQQISMSDSMTLLNIVDQNPTPADLDAKLKAMPQLPQMMVKKLEDDYGQYLVNVQNAKQAAANAPRQPEQLMRDWVNNMLSQKIMVKKDDEYTLTLIKQGSTVMLNGNDVSKGLPPSVLNGIVPQDTTTLKTNQLLNQLQALLVASAAAGNAHTPPSYSIVSAASVIPHLKNGEQDLKTSWGSEITLSNATDNSYRITVPQVPADICPMLEDKIQHTSLNLTDITTCNPSSPTDFSFTVNR